VGFIQLKGVSKKYLKQSILENVNLTISEGDIFGIIGKSGSGKTTLLNLMSGFIDPSQGEVSYISKVDHHPKNLHKNLHKIKKHIGFTPQHYSFYPKLTVKENMLHFGNLYGIKKQMLIHNAKNLLEFTNLYEHKDKLAEHLSGGMKKRLDISCSLVHKPKILFLDEPTADLDPIMQQEIITLIQQVNQQGITIVIASHDLDNIEKICTKLAVINQGKVSTYGEFEEVRKPYLKETININIRTGRDREKIIEIAKRLPVNKIVDQGHQLVLYPENPESVIIELMRIVKEENLYLNDLDIRKPTLSEIFPRIASEQEE